VKDGNTCTYRKMKRSYFKLGLANARTEIPLLRMVAILQRHTCSQSIKEPNWGYSQEEQAQYSAEASEVHDQREGYDDWWFTVGKWCVSISNPKLSWREVENKVKSDGTNKSIAPFPMVQLKKSPGGGFSDASSLSKVAREDKNFLLRQFAIYQPNFIVSCGLWSIFTDVLFSGNNEIYVAPNGIEYFISSDKEVNLNNVCILNFCHPSMRCSNALNGAVSFALRDAVNFISEQKIQL